VLLLSDQGSASTLALEFTLAAQQERVNPFLALALPRGFVRLAPGLERLLAENQQRLVSAFDVFATVNHLLHWRGRAAAGPAEYEAWAAAGNFSGGGEAGKGGGVVWTRSLLAPLKAGRTCLEARVQGEYCSCFAY
jgi:hypothetical protein